MLIIFNDSQINNNEIPINYKSIRNNKPWKIENFPLHSTNFRQINKIPSETFYILLDFKHKLIQAYQPLIHNSKLPVLFQKILGKRLHKAEETHNRVDLLATSQDLHPRQNQLVEPTQRQFEDHQLHHLRKIKITTKAHLKLAISHVSLNKFIYRN